MKTEDLLKFIRSLNNKQVVASSGFLIGFFWTFKLFSRRTWKFPLSTILNASLDGLVCSAGSSLLTFVLPEEYYFTVPMAAAISVFYAQTLGILDDSKKKGKDNSGSESPNYNYAIN